LPIERATAINEYCSLDFVSDRLSDGRRIRILTIQDEYSRCALGTIVDTSIGGVRVVRELNEVLKKRGKPKKIISDNGTELTSNAVLQWTQGLGIHGITLRQGNRMKMLL